MIKTKDGKKRLLNADEIECRVGQKSKDGSKYSVLLYKTARTDMDVLDEVFGLDGWQVEYHTIGDKLFCNLGVFSEPRGGWIWKESNGAESNIEAEKGQASDAFKRAGFMFGIGRELYSAPQIWLESSISPYSLEVAEIGYDENDKISDLVISGKRDGQNERETVFKFHNGKAVSEKPNQKPQPKPTDVDHDTLERIRDIAQKLEFEGKKTNDILAYYHVKTIGEIPLPLWEKMLTKARGEA